MTKPRDEFVGLLKKSREVSWVVAEWLTRAGAICRMLPGTTAPSEADRYSHTDLGDLEIVMRCEVKHWPNMDFKSLSDVPYKNVIVDEAYKISKYPKATLYGYVIVNSSCTGALLISRNTRRHWLELEMRDGREGDIRKYTVCPREFVEYVRI